MVGSMHQKCTRAVFYLHYSDIGSSVCQSEVLLRSSLNRADVSVYVDGMGKSCVCGVAYATALCSSRVFGHGPSSFTLFSSLPFLLPNLAAPFNPDSAPIGREGGNPFSLLRCISLAVLSLSAALNAFRFRNCSCSALTLTVSFCLQGDRLISIPKLGMWREMEPLCHRVSL